MSHAPAVASVLAVEVAVARGGNSGRGLAREDLPLWGREKREKGIERERIERQRRHVPVHRPELHRRPWFPLRRPRPPPLSSPPPPSLQAAPHPRPSSPSSNPPSPAAR